MIDYSDKFTVITRNKETGYIVKVANIVGCSYEEILEIAQEYFNGKDCYTYDIIQDKTLFDVVYHYENTMEDIYGDMFNLTNKIRNVNSLGDDIYEDMQ